MVNSMLTRVPERVDFFIGEWHNSLVTKCSGIIKYQWRHGIKDGIRGFLFYGPPGTGKTWCTWKIAEILGLLDLPEREREEAVIYRDCADLAFPRYGETEKQIRFVFEQGRRKAMELRKRGKDLGVLYIFDDAEALFLTRSYGAKLDTWYIAQLNVFFHELDLMDTSSEAIVLATNRRDLLDEALLDRLYPIEFPLPNVEMLIEYAKKLCQRLGVDKEYTMLAINEIKRRSSELHSNLSFRDARRIVMERYIEFTSSRI